jgi:hypothetical protein
MTPSWQVKQKLVREGACAAWCEVGWKLNTAGSCVTNNNRPHMHSRLSPTITGHRYFYSNPLTKMLAEMAGMGTTTHLRLKP